MAGPVKVPHGRARARNYAIADSGGLVATKVSISKVRSVPKGTGLRLHQDFKASAMANSALSRERLRSKP